MLLEQKLDWPRGEGGVDQNSESLLDCADQFALTWHALECH